MHIRTDDDVYRVDAVWLGPPRATFPWRARYSAYGVGLIVMIVVMFLQRRLGIPLGFFSVAWALLITVLVTRFVSRRINDERPLLEWLTLFAHELRGPRARTRSVGGALSTGGVRVRRERPHGAPTPIALPPGSTPTGSARVLGVPGSAATSGVRDHDAPAPPRAARRPETPARPGRPVVGPDTPGFSGAAPAHRARRTAARSTARGRRPDAGFGPPSATEIGEPVVPRQQAAPEGSRDAGPTPALPAPPSPTASSMAAWTTPAPERDVVRVRSRRAEPSRAPRTRDAGRRRDDTGWGPFPSGASGAPEVSGAFGPGARRGSGDSTDRDDGAPA